MRTGTHGLPVIFVALLAGALAVAPPALHWIVLDPGHSHAVALQATMLPGIDPEVRVYAPLGPDVNAYLAGVARFNARSANPTRWSYSVFAGPGWLERAYAEPAGNIVVLSGRNENKIDYILAALQHGQHVLADKPWIIESRDLPRLESALASAAANRLVAYDEMTQRFDVAYRLERELASDSGVFGRPDPGTPANPAVRMENRHSLLKYSGGRPSLRPAWFFDIRQQGEGIADVGTHLVDLVFWTLFPGQGIDYRRDIAVLAASREPLVITAGQFEEVTGIQPWPAFLSGAVRDNQLIYYTNTRGVFTVRGVHVGVDVRWEYEAPPASGDSYFAAYRGTRSDILLRAGAGEHYVPEVYVVPVPNARDAVRAALERRLAALAPVWPGLSVEAQGEAFHAVIPPATRNSGDQHFARLVDRFLGYVRDPKSLPAWEQANLLAKYYVTTRTVELARQSGSK
jgi:predicted dehydrogenase